MDTLSRSDLAHALCDAHASLTVADARHLVSLLFRDILPTALKRGRTIKLQGFGSFRVTACAARQFVRPGTDQRVPARNTRAVRFQASRTLKAYVSGGAR